MNPYFEALDFPSIIDKLKEHALSDKAKQALDELSPCLNEDLCRRKMAETSAARAVLDGCGSPPLASMKGIDQLLSFAEIGSMLLPEQLTNIARFSISCRRLSAYLKRGEGFGQDVAFYGRSLIDLSELQKEIEACVNEVKVFDEASSALRDLRRRMERTEAQIKEKLAHILQSRKQYLSDSYIANRNGHYVLPVQRQYQAQFGGTVIEVSNKGSTVFMEPSAIVSLQEELTRLSVDEDCETRRILYTLSGSVAEFAPMIRSNMDLMEQLDLLFARAKYSAAIGARPVEIGCKRRIKIIQGRHPLLKAELCVPLDFEINESDSGVIITGPNTGGKTVSIKTVGLLSLMAQCGLHIPCEEGSYIAMQDGLWCDIGDSQNISQNLSTFSGHITNIIKILENASKDSLVILDELGSGTDPTEGMGIAIAVLEELRRRECMFLVTTHYPQVKSYAEKSEGIKSARMAFDKESLRPLYRLEMDKSGESCALYIAERLGMAPHLLECARHEVYGTEMKLDGSHSSMKAPKSKLVRSVPPKQVFDPSVKFSMGDSVIVLPDKETGIVYRPADEKGDVIVQIKGVKQRVKHTRVQLQIPASELYPPDYDFSIIFDSVENRKARHTINRRFDENAVVSYEADEL